MQQLGVQPSGPGDRLALKPLDDVQSLPKAGWMSGTHLGPFGIAPVELGVDERSDVDTMIVTFSISPLMSTPTSSTPRILRPCR
jgi:hypothetical protein